MSQSPIFWMKDISVRRNKIQILEDVSWLVNQNENWVVVGGNGSGKTSLLNVLMGYLTPTEGTVQMPGRGNATESKTQSWDDWRKRIGFVSSSISQMIDLDELAIDIVAAGRDAQINTWGTKQDPKTIAAAEKILKKVKCEHLRDQPWAYLSQGERQRLLIGRALMVQRMKVLVLDEPCAGLDPVAREQFLHFMEELAQTGPVKNMILVTHHVEEIFPSITHALVLKDGKVLARGEKKRALNSASMSQAFGSDLLLRSRLARYRLYFQEELEDRSKSAPM